MLRLVVAGLLLWILAADTGARLARLQLAAMPDFDYLAEVRHLRSAGRYGEALVVAEAGIDAASDADAQKSLLDEKGRTLDEQASVLRRAGDLGMGALSGRGDSLESLVGALAADFFVVGDVRDLVIQGGRYALDGETDEVILVLSGVGLATTLAPEIDWAPSLLKVARRAGTLTRGLGDFVVAAVRAGRFDELKVLLGDVRALASRASPGGAVRLLRHADGPGDAAALARFVERQPAGAFALHATGADGASLVKRLGPAADAAVIQGARKGAWGVAWLRGSGPRLLLRPHPIVGLLKGLWKGNAQEAVRRVLSEMDAHAWWAIPLLAAWAFVECGLLARRVVAPGFGSGAGRAAAGAGAGAAPGP